MGRVIESMNRLHSIDSKLPPGLHWADEALLVLILRSIRGIDR